MRATLAAIGDVRERLEKASQTQRAALYNALGLRATFDPINRSSGSRLHRRFARSTGMAMVVSEGGLGTKPPAAHTALTRTSVLQSVDGRSGRLPSVVASRDAHGARVPLRGPPEGSTVPAADSQG